MTWTLAVDESGRFEGQAVPLGNTERYAFVIGGVLCPGPAADLARTWDQAIRRAEPSAAFPPHATELVPAVRTSLRQAAIAEVEAAGGVWIFLVEDASAQGPVAELARYVRMLAELVDMAGRIAARHGARRLDVRPAQRTVPLLSKHADQARSSGLAARDWKHDGSLSVRTFAEVEIRQALDALSREPTGSLGAWPVLASIDVTSAYSKVVHPGAIFADLGCHHLYATLRDSPATSLEDLEESFSTKNGRALLVFARAGLRAVRQLDRALRDIPADLVRAGRALSGLVSKAQAGIPELSGYAAMREGTVGAAKHLWLAAIETLAALPEGMIRRVTHQLAAHAAAQLAEKSGDYEGTWHALEDGWSGATTLAHRARSIITSRETAALLWRLTMQCANHRGDILMAARAREQCDAIFGRALSLTLLVERLHVHNLANGELQNRHLVSSGEVGARGPALEAEANRLIAAANDAGAIVELAGAALAPPPSAVTLPPEETALWAAYQRGAPSFRAPDHERGKSYGTAARSLAFLGQLDRATELLFEARSYFVDAPEHLRFNASVLARVELERFRIDPRVESPALGAVMDLTGAMGLRNPRAALAAVQQDRKVRFEIDLLLRALGWGAMSSALPRDSWARALSATGTDSLLGVCSHLRSHPTEMLARHAGEVLRAAGDEVPAQRWFELSLSLSDGSDPSTTLWRLGAFTRRLAAEAGFRGEGAPGEILNPTFEYR